MTSSDDQSQSFLNSEAISDVFFIEIVENKLNIKRDEFKLRLVLLSPATGKNENFLAVLYRAKILIEIHITKERKSVDVIIKALLSTLPEMKEMGVFPRERFVYDNVLSSFEKIWLEKADEKIKFGPRSIKFETDPYEQIILDDLKAEGFEMQDRKVGLSLLQTRMVLTKLAKFHAAGAVRYQKDGIIQEYFERQLPTPGNPESNHFYDGLQKLFRGFIDCIRSYGGFEKYADKFETWNFPKLSSQWFDVAVPMKSGFQVFNHGDLWLNNMMFKMDEDGNPLEVSLIDFQTPCWGSPSGDLIYFLISSVADDVKVEHFDEFIELYHKELAGALIKLGYNRNQIPSLTDLKDDFLEKSGFICLCFLLVLFVSKYNSSAEMNISMIMSGGDPEMIQRIYNNEDYKKAIQSWLPFLDARGYLDVLIVKPKMEETRENEEA